MNLIGKEMSVAGEEIDHQCCFILHHYHHRLGRDSHTSLSHTHTHTHTHTHLLFQVLIWPLPHHFTSAERWRQHHSFMVLKEAASHYSCSLPFPSLPSSSNILAMVDTYTNQLCTRRHHYFSLSPISPQQAQPQSILARWRASERLPLPYKKNQV